MVPPTENIKKEILVVCVMCLLYLVTVYVIGSNKVYLNLKFEFEWFSLFAHVAENWNVLWLIIFTSVFIHVKISWYDMAVVDCYFRKTKDSAISITVHGAHRGHHSGTSRQGPRSPPEDRTPVNETHKCSIPKWTNSDPTETQGATATVPATSPIT